MRSLFAAFAETLAWLILAFVACTCIGVFIYYVPLSMAVFVMPVIAIIFTFIFMVSVTTEKYERMK